jgi:hypothetical protein
VSSFEEEMSEALKDVQRKVFLDLIPAHRGMTLAELSVLSRGEFSDVLSSVTVGEVIHAGRKSLSGELDALARGRAGADDVDTRTAAGRSDYDARVLEFIRACDGPVSASEIRDHVKGTSLQVRKAVARLIESEHVTWHGLARGTRYSAL